MNEIQENKEIGEKLQAYTSFFEESSAGFSAIDKIFERLVTRVLQLNETYGGLDEEEEAGEVENAQLAQLRILERDFSGYLKKYGVSIGALRDELDRIIEFGEAMIHAMEAERC